MKAHLRPTYDRAVQAMESEDFQGARDVLLNLHQQDPEAVEILLFLGYMDGKLGDVVQRIETFRKATELEPQLELASLGLFHALWEADRTDEAFDEMRRFLSQYESEEYTRLLADMKKRWSR